MVVNPASPNPATAADWSLPVCGNACLLLLALLLAPLLVFLTSPLLLAMPLPSPLPLL